MTNLPVSVIVVSRNRPDALMRCLKGIEQLDYPAFELIVVADPAGVRAVELAGLGARIKTVSFDRANISAARNLGIAIAAGDIIAFIDDDAVPETGWLFHLTQPFADPDVAAAGGYVRGRNGISFQSTAQSVDQLGAHSPLPMQGNAPQIFSARRGWAIKTEGTNCAFRSDVLREFGGFDPAFRFYLDETDLNLRLSEQALNTAIVPLAQVHHGFAASERRSANRMPRDLFDVGASMAVFLRKHAAPEQLEPGLTRLREEQRARLLRHMVAGICEPSDIAPVLSTLDKGMAEGRQRKIGPLPALKKTDAAFLAFSVAPAFTGHEILSGRPWSLTRLRARAERLVAQGHRVSLFIFSPTALFHHVRFDPRGYWEQRGGLFGKADRTDPLFRLFRFRKRLKTEIIRLQRPRLFTR